MNKVIKSRHIVMQPLILVALKLSTQKSFLYASILLIFGGSMLDVLDGIYNKDKTSKDIVLGPFFKLFLYNALLLCINKYTKVPMSKYLNVSKTLTLASMIGLILSVLIAKFIRSAFTEKNYIYSDIYEILKYLYASYFILGLAFIFLSLIKNYVMTFHFFIIYVGLTMLLAITTILYLAYRPRK